MRRSARPRRRWSRVPGRWLSWPPPISRARLFSARPFRVCLESVELSDPERFELRQPIAQLDKRFLPQAIHFDARVLLETALLDETGFAQHTQVPAHRRS